MKPKYQQPNSIKMKKYLITLLGILLISFVSAVPVIDDVTIGDTVISEDIVICAEVSDDVSEIILIRINLHAENPLWNWGLIMYKEGDLYCRTLSPEFMGAYDGKEISYYISARNLLSEVTVSPTYHFTYSLAPFCGDGTCNVGEGCSSCPADCGTCISYSDNDESSSSRPTQFCEPIWKCGTWSSCESGRMTRKCYDSNYCSYSYNEPNEVTSCEINENVLVKQGVNYLPIFVFLGLIGIVAFAILVSVLARK